ncbi:MAG: hypothetical protein PHQ27_10975, partial [Victivallales bacterium]|nr:hypothetical protein [Victivallales bacterium]
RTFKTLNQETIQDRKHQELRQEFQNEFAELRRWLDRPDLSECNADELLRIQTRLINLLKKLGENRFLYDYMSPADRQYLDGRVVALKKILQNYKDQENRKKATDLDERHRQQNDQRRNHERNDLVVNNEINHFILAAARFAALPERQRNVVTLGQAFSMVSRKDLPERFYPLQNFIQSVYRLPRNAAAVVSAYRQYFLNQSIPDTEPLQGFTITDIEHGNIYLEMKLDYGVRKKRISWWELPGKSRAALLEHAFGTGKRLQGIRSEDIAVILRELLNCNAYETFFSLLQQSSTLNEQDEKLWRETGNLFHRTAAEIPMIIRWNQAQQYREQKNYTAAFDTLSLIAAKGAGTDFQQRFAARMARDMESLRRTSPSLRLREMLHDFEQHFRAGKYSEAQQIIMSAYSRYSHCPDLSAILEQQLENSRKAVSSHRDQSSPPDAVRMNAIFGAPPPPGVIQNRTLMIADHSRLPAASPVRTALTMVGDWDIGDWPAVVAVMPTLKAHFDREFTLSSPRFNDDRDALLYCSGLAAVSREAYPLLEKILRRLLSDPNGKPSSRAATGFAAALYAGIRQYPHAISLVRGAATDTPDSLRFQLGIQELQLLLLQPDFREQDFSAAAKALLRNYGSQKQYRHDLAWIALADKIVGGNFTFSDLDAVTACPPDNGQLCTGLVAEAAAYAAVHDRFPDNGLLALADLNDKVISGNTANADLWRKNLFLKLAAASGIDEFSHDLDDALHDYRLCALPWYPSLLLLQFAVASAQNPETGPDLATSYHSAVGNCPLATPALDNAWRELHHDDPSAWLARLPQQHCRNKFFITAAAGLWFNFYRYAAVDRILKLLREQESILSWDERLLQKKIARLIME